MIGQERKRRFDHAWARTAVEQFMKKTGVDWEVAMDTVLDHLKEQTDPKAFRIHMWRAMKRWQEFVKPGMPADEEGLRWSTAMKRQELVDMIRLLRRVLAGDWQYGETTESVLQKTKLKDGEAPHPYRFRQMEFPWPFDCQWPQPQPKKESGDVTETVRTSDAGHGEESKDGSGGVQEQELP